MSEAENCSDIGGEYALYDALREAREDLHEDRQRRLDSIKGKYIIVCDGKRGLIYLQDKRISQKHHWTKYLANAISFNNPDSAKAECAKYRFNNPRVALVDKNCGLQFLA